MSEAAASAMMAAMFDIDEFVKDCSVAVGELEARPAIRELVTRAVADHASVADAMAHHTAGITVLHNTADLTVLNVVWGPGMKLQPHDHRMWAAIGIYAGQENNGFYRRQGDTIIDSGGKELRDGDVLMLGDDAIHSVANPLRSYTGAIHVYGGDFVTKPRSVWDPESRVEGPFSMDRLREQFEASNHAAPA